MWKKSCIWFYCLYKYTFNIKVILYGVTSLHFYTIYILFYLFILKHHWYLKTCYSYLKPIINIRKHVICILNLLLVIDNLWCLEKYVIYIWKHVNHFSLTCCSYYIILSLVCMQFLWDVLLLFVCDRHFL